MRVVRRRARAGELGGGAGECRQLVALVAGAVVVDHALDLLDRNARHDFRQRRVEPRQNRDRHRVAVRRVARDRRERDDARRLERRDTDEPLVDVRRIGDHDLGHTDDGAEVFEPGEDLAIGPVLQLVVPVRQLLGGRRSGRLRHEGDVGLHRASGQRQGDGGNARHRDNHHVKVVHEIHYTLFCYFVNLFIYTTQSFVAGQTVSPLLVPSSFVVQCLG